MRRTQVYLDEEVLEGLRLRAAREGRSVASLVRDAARAYLSSKTERSVSDPFGEMIGCYEGEPDEAVEHDHYLYALPKSRPRGGRS